MGSPIKINSISIDLKTAVNETDVAKCDHFSMRGFAAETRKSDRRKSWPFSEESVRLSDEQNDSNPSQPSRKHKWWGCESCIRDIDLSGTKDSPHSNPVTLGGKPLVIISASDLVTVTGHEIERMTDNSVNAVFKENEDVNIERSQEHDQTAQTVAATTLVENVHPPSMDDQTVAATTLVENVHPPSMDASTSRRSKSRKLESQKPVANKRRKVRAKKPSSVDISSSKGKQTVDQAAATALGSSEIAGVAEKPRLPNASKKRRGSCVAVESVKASSAKNMSGSQTRKVPRLRRLSDIEDTTRPSGGSNNNPRKEEPSSKTESVRGKKRKLPLPENNDVSWTLGTNGVAPDSDQGDGESTDSGFDRDPIKGKQKNPRFQIVDEFVPSQEEIRENEADPGTSALPTPVASLSSGKDSVSCSRSAKKTTPRLSKKKMKPVIGNGKKTLTTGADEGNQVKPGTGPSTNAISQPTRDLLKEKVGSLFDDDRLASEGYVRKSSTPQANDKPVLSLQVQDSDHVRAKDAEANNSLPVSAPSSKSNTGADVVDLGSNSNNANTSSAFRNVTPRHTPSSTEVAPDLSCVLQKDADRKGKRIMVEENDEASGSQSHDAKENNDDIPMEIVEVLRCLPDKQEGVSNKQPPQEPAPKPKKALMIDLNVTYDSEASSEDNSINISVNTSKPPSEDNNNNISVNTSKPTRPSDTSARKEEHLPVGKQQRPPLDFFPISQSNYVPSPLGSFPPTKEIPASPSIGYSDHNRQWLGNVPTMASQNLSPSPYRMLRGCNTCHTLPHQYREAAPHQIWPSSMMPPPPPQSLHRPSSMMPPPPPPPHGLHRPSSMMPPPPPQGLHRPASFNMDQPPNLGMLSQASSGNGNPWNGLNFVASNGKQKCGPNSEFSFACKHGGGVGSSSRPMDAYSKESTMPALHLLSMMDPRVRSNAPADHHGNTKFTKRHFPPVNRFKFPTGGSSKTTSYQTKQTPFHLYSTTTFAPEPARTTFPPVQLPASTTKIRVEYERTRSKFNQEKAAKRQGKVAPVRASREKQVLPSSSNDQGKFQLLGASSAVKLPLKSRMTENEKNRKRKAESSSDVSARASTSSSGPMLCSFNRNPADFTVAIPGNIYLFTGGPPEVASLGAYKRKTTLCMEVALNPAGPVA